MPVPDYKGAQSYALGRLETELPAYLTYHSIVHTRDEVLPAVERFAALEGVGEDGLVLVRTAGAFHDLGYIHRNVGHEAASAAIAGKVLPRYGYSYGQITAVQDIIMATHLPQSPRNRLQEIVADADLDVLGQDDFLERNTDLRAELAVAFGPVSDEKWYLSQLRFMKGHRYWTAAAQRLREAGKRENIAQLARQLAKCQSSLTGTG